MPAHAFPILHTSRLVLDEIRDEDHQRIYEIFSDPEVMCHYDMEPLVKPEEGVEMVSFLRNKFASRSGLRWAIREQISGELIGTCGFNSWVSFDHSAIIGYELASRFWGAGFATEAIASVIALAFKSEGTTPRLPITVNRIEASVVPENLSSEKVLRKTGFKLEGLLREKSFWGGRYHDLNLFSLLKRDYLASQREQAT